MNFVKANGADPDEIMHDAAFYRGLPCADPESFVRGGPNMITFFIIFYLVDKGIEDPNINVNGPSSARQRNPI